MVPALEAMMNRVQTLLPSSSCAATLKSEHKQRRVTRSPTICSCRNSHCAPHQSLFHHTRLFCIPHSSDSSHPPTMVSAFIQFPVSDEGGRLSGLVSPQTSEKHIACLDNHTLCCRTLYRVGVPDAECRGQGRVLGRRRVPHRGDAGRHLHEDQGRLVHSRWAQRSHWQRLLLVHFSPHLEPFLSLKLLATTQHISQKVFTLSRKVDVCKPLPTASHRRQPIELDAIMDTTWVWPFSYHVCDLVCCWGGGDPPHLSVWPCSQTRCSV